jgi:hypothetical protein
MTHVMQVRRRGEHPEEGAEDVFCARLPQRSAKRVHERTRRTRVLRTLKAQRTRQAAAAIINLIPNVKLAGS